MAQFCTQCGSSVDSAFCAKCGAASNRVQIPTSNLASRKTSGALKNVLALVSFFVVLPVVLLVIIGGGTTAPTPKGSACAADHSGDSCRRAEAMQLRNAKYQMEGSTEQALDNFNSAIAENGPVVPDVAWEHLGPKTTVCFAQTKIGYSAVHDVFRCGDVQPGMTHEQVSTALAGKAEVMPGKLEGARVGDTQILTYRIQTFVNKQNFLAYEKASANVYTGKDSGQFVAEVLKGGSVTLRFENDVLVSVSKD